MTEIYLNTCELFEMGNLCRQCRFVWVVCDCKSWPLSMYVYSMPQVFTILNMGKEIPTRNTQTERVQTSKAGNASFVFRSEVISEIEARLGKCDEAGEALEDEAPSSEEIKDLSRPALRALVYCSGWKRRKLPYAEWKRRYKKVVKHDF